MNGAHGGGGNDHLDGNAGVNTLAGDAGADVCQNYAQATACDLHVYSCNTGTKRDCDRAPENACETDTATSPLNCGACGTVCPPPTNASAACVASTCGIGTCNAGFGNCDGSAANGCEVTFASDAANCGSCGAACASGQICQAGSCIANPSSVGGQFGGGTVFYVLQPGDPGYDANVPHGLIAAPSDQTSVNIIWATTATQCFGAGDVLSNCQVTSIYPNASVAASRAANTAIGAGPANTAAIVARLDAAGVSHASYAAGVVDDYTVTVGGVTYSDWYLPSRDELAKLWENRAYMPNRVNTWYWSSSEGSDNKAYMQNFAASWAQVIIDDKSHANVQRVRAIRSF